MSFIKFIPYGEKLPSDFLTTCQTEIQIWQELTMLRHLTGANATYAREATASYIDQAKIYFLDAAKSNWRSSGLLYYYSFLNLAKAYLITRRTVSARTLKSTSIYHGLTATPQNPVNIINFRIEIHPPIQNNKRNIFSNFYQKLIGEPWPFNNQITLTMADIVSYCEDISHEIFNFYSIPKEIIGTYSLIRKDNTNWWFEMLVPNINIPTVQRDFGPYISLITNSVGLNQADKSDWLTAHDVTAAQFRDLSLVRINQLAYNNANSNQQFMNLSDDVKRYFKGFILPTPSHNHSTISIWHFVPKIRLNGAWMKWHPLLSNYLFAFMLSSVLRYQPHLFPVNSKDAFIAEAWCNQSATSSLRYFLMELSANNLRLN